MCFSSKAKKEDWKSYRPGDRWRNYDGNMLFRLGKGRPGNAGKSTGSLGSKKDQNTRTYKAANVIAALILINIKLEVAPANVRNRGKEA